MSDLQYAMNSPFPGMYPYLENDCPEVHASLIVYARNQINDQLPFVLCAKIERNLSIVEEGASDRHIRPDLHVADVGGSRSTGLVVHDFANQLVVEIVD